MRTAVLLVCSREDAVRGTRAEPVAAYVIRAPAGFPNGLGTTAVAFLGRRKIVNPFCLTNGVEPNMFGNMGHSDRTTSFWFRDFNPNGLRLAWPNSCDLAGDFDGRQGLLYVR